PTPKRLGRAIGRRTVPTPKRLARRLRGRTLPRPVGLSPCTARQTTTSVTIRIRACAINWHAIRARVIDNRQPSNRGRAARRRICVPTGGQYWTGRPAGDSLIDQRPARMHEHFAFLAVEALRDA